jgi:hypothetical protein
VQSWPLAGGAGRASVVSGNAISEALSSRPSSASWLVTVRLSAASRTDAALGGTAWPARARTPTSSACEVGPFIWGAGLMHGTGSLRVAEEMTISSSGSLGALESLRAAQPRWGASAIAMTPKVLRVRRVWLMSCAPTERLRLGPNDSRSVAC